MLFAGGIVQGVDLNNPGLPFTERRNPSFLICAGAVSLPSS